MNAMLASKKKQELVGLPVQSRDSKYSLNSSLGTMTSGFKKQDPPAYKLASIGTLMGTQKQLNEIQAKTKHKELSEVHGPVSNYDGKNRHEDSRI